MSEQQSRDHHYVPQWYQRRFMKDGQSTYYYLDLRPEPVGHKNIRRKDLLPWGPKRCFYKEDLYTVKLGGWSSDEIETKFFGEIDSRGRDAVKTFADYKGYCNELHEAYPALLKYMDAQRFRTPKGLDWLALMSRGDKNLRLLFLQCVYGFHGTMWMEGVWEVVRADNSQTKFIVSDEPVTFFNRTSFPNEIVYPRDTILEQVGTRTIFPLSMNACLIISHVQFTRNPWAKPSEHKPIIDVKCRNATISYCHVKVVRDISCVACTSAVRWANRAMLAKISSALLVQAKGLGSALCGKPGDRREVFHVFGS